MLKMRPLESIYGRNSRLTPKEAGELGGDEVNARDGGLGANIGGVNRPDWIAVGVGAGVSEFALSRRLRLGCGSGVGL